MGNFHALGFSLASDEDDEDNKSRARVERERDCQGQNTRPGLRRRVPRGREENLVICVDGGGGSRGLPRRVRDYSVEPGIFLPVQQRLPENFSNLDEILPAPRTAVHVLPTMRVSYEHLISGDGLCTVCIVGFERGDEAHQMPCGHLYHPSCIRPWLELQGSCPICRFQTFNKSDKD